MSNYIAVDLKVIEVLAPMVARASGITEDRALAGLVRLWHRCWSTTSDVVTESQLAGIFGGERLHEVASALEADFLERVPTGWRVRGAARYLRLKESRRLGALKTNALRATASARSKSDEQRTLPDALPPSTEHRAPNTEIKSTAPKKPAPESDRLVADFLDIIKSPYVWQGAKDGVAFHALRRTAEMDEISRRWRIGLNSSGWLGVRTLAQLRSKWNDLAEGQVLDLRKPVPAATFTETKTVGDF